MEIQKLSVRYRVRQLAERDADAVLALYRGNPQYFDAMHDSPTLESARADLTALPPKKTAEDKFYLGFYEGETVIAVMDLILSYPDERTAWIGLFMVSGMRQGRGIGSRIVKDALSYLKTLGFFAVRLGYVETNPQSKAFWEKNEFRPTGFKSQQEKYTIVLMEKEL